MLPPYRELLCESKSTCAFVHHLCSHLCMHLCKPVDWPKSWKRPGVAQVRHQRPCAPVWLPTWGHALMAKPRLSGAQRRKLNAQRIAEAGGVVMPRLPALGSLESVRSFRAELSTIYAAMRRGAVPTEVGTRLVYVLNVGAALAKAEQELQELTHLREQIARIEGDGPGLPALGYLEPDDAAGSLNGSEISEGEPQP